jgi:acetyl esterase/lipase
MAISIRKLLGIALGAASAAMGGLIASPTIHDRLWIGHAFLSEFPWVSALVGTSGAVMSLSKRPRTFWGAVLAGAGIGLSLLPVMRVKSTIRDMDKAMLEGLGAKYEAAVPPVMRERLAQTRWSIGSTVKWSYKFPNVKITRDVVYTQPGLRPLKLDIYQPDAPPPIGKQYPAVVVIHGGAWRSYDKGGVFVPHHSYLANQGYIVFDIQYRFSGEAIWPAQLQDVQCAIRWVKARAKQFNIDPRRMALLGRSSGGHMALMAAYRANDPKIGKICEDEQDSSVAAVVAIYPPTDLRIWQSVPGSAVVDLLGGLTSEVPEAYADASPIEFVRNGLPPTLLVQGYMDELVNPIHVELLHNLLRGTDTPSVLLRIPWGRHVFDAVMSGLGAQLSQYNIDRFLAWCLYRGIKDDTADLAGVPY